MAYFIPVLAALLISCQPSEFLSLDSTSEASKSDSPQTQNEPNSLAVNDQWREWPLTLKKPDKKTLEFLVVLDTSPSMNRNLKKLGGKLSPLLTAISDYKWRMAFTTAENGTGSPSELWQNYAGGDLLEQTALIKKSSLKSRSLWWNYRQQLYAGFLEKLKSHWQRLGNPFGSFGKLMNLEGPAITEKKLGSNSVTFQVLKERILTADTPDYELIFKNTVSHETIELLQCPNSSSACTTREIPLCTLPPFCGSNIEQPLLSLKSAMERIHFDNGFFFQPNTDLAVLFITNDDAEHTDKQKVQNPTQAEDVMNTFNQLLRPLNKRFFAFGILPLDEKCLSKEADGYGFYSERVAKLAEQADGGFNISICEKDYGPGLQRISEVIKTLVEQPSVTIEEPFIPETLRVDFLDGPVIPWKLKGKKLIFEYTPAQDTKIKLHYQIP